MKELIGNILKSTGYLVINKTLAKKVSLEAAICLSDLITKESYFRDHNMLDNEGFFFNTRENIAKDTTLSFYQQRKSLKKLEKLGILEIKEYGIPKKAYYRIDYLPVIKNLTTSDKETLHQEVKKLNINNNNNNNNNIYKVKETKKIDKNTDSYNKFLNEYNKVFNRKTKSMEGWKKNAEFWLTIYSEDEILQAIRQIPSDSFWKDKMDLTILFRRKNSQGENVDYIQKLLTSIEDKKPKRFMIGGEL